MTEELIQAVVMGIPVTIMIVFTALIVRAGDKTRKKYEALEDLIRSGKISPAEAINTILEKRPH